MLNYLHGTPFWIEQKDEMYHFNSDSEFFGKNLKIQKGETVLDIGTNNGVLLCYGSLYEPSLLYGIDIFPEVCNLARENLKRNGIDAQIETICLQDLQHEPFDVIICNPPYFNDIEDDHHFLSKYVFAARHERFLPLEDLFIHANRLLKKDGLLQIIYPYRLILQLIHMANKNGFYEEAYRLAYDKEMGQKKSVILSFRKVEKKAVMYIQPAYMDNRNTFKLD